MDRNFGEWYLLADPDSNHDRNVSRWEGIETFCKSVSVMDIVELSRLFYSYPNRNANFIEKFQETFQKSDSTFPLKDNEYILSILAGASLANFLKGRNQNLSLVAAYALFCPSMNKSRKGVCIPEIVNRSIDYLIKRSSSLRSPQNIKRIQSPKNSLDQLSVEIINHINDPAPPEASSKMKAFLNRLSSSLDSVVDKVNSIAIQQNLDREESDILWWTMGQYSRDLNNPIKDIDLLYGSLIAGKEIADLTRVLPGPFATQAFICKFLDKYILDIDKEQQLKEFTNSAPIEWRTKWFSKYKDIDSVNMCPVISSFLKSIEVPAPDGWCSSFTATTGIDSNFMVSPLNIASQLYHETLFLRLVEE